MADRRCFSKKITESDAFLEMPMSARCLYFSLNMNADDDGFVNAPKKIMRMMGATEDDMKILIVKKFVIAFESGVIVIKHWWLNNLLRKDRYQETEYKDEKALLSIKENNVYTLNGNQMATNGIPNGNQVAPQHNITKHNITKLNIKEDNINIIEEKNDAVASSQVPKHKYGTFKNILLTDKEYQTLSNDYPNYEQAIEYLSEYKEMKGYKCKSDYLAIRKWVFDAIKRESIEKKKLDNMEQQNKNTKKSGNIFLNLLNEMEDKENG